MWNAVIEDPPVEVIPAHNAIYSCEKYAEGRLAKAGTQTAHPQTQKTASALRAPAIEHQTDAAGLLRGLLEDQPEGWTAQHHPQRTNNTSKERERLFAIGHTRLHTGSRSATTAGIYFWSRPATGGCLTLHLSDTHAQAGRPASGKREGASSKRFGLPHKITHSRMLPKEGASRAQARPLLMLPCVLTDTSGMVVRAVVTSSWLL